MEVLFEHIFLISATAHNCNFLVGDINRDRSTDIVIQRYTV